MALECGFTMFTKQECDDGHRCHLVALERLYDNWSTGLNKCECRMRWPGQSHI
jgi:hypothetical protein